MIKFGSKQWFLTRNYNEPNIKLLITDLLQQNAGKEACDELMALNNTDLKDIHDIYHSVNSNDSSRLVAYLYKKKLRFSIKNTIINYINEMSQTDEIRTNIFHDVDSLINKMQMLNLNKLCKLALDFLHKNSSELKKQSKDDYNSIIDSIAEAISSYIIFKEKDKSLPSVTDEQSLNKLPLILSDGRLYQPGNQHDWLRNLSWLLSHIHKGSTFLICSHILESSLYRKTTGYSAQISGFAREVAILFKLGYRFKYTPDTTFLLPPHTSLDHLSLLDINLSQQDEITHYMDALKHNAQHYIHILKKENLSLNHGIFMKKVKKNPLHCNRSVKHDNGHQSNSLESSPNANNSKDNTSYLHTTRL